MASIKISAGADPVTLVGTDKVPVARSASTTAYAATMAEVSTWTNTGLPYSATSPAMDSIAAPGTVASVSRGDHVHPTDTSRYAASNPSGYQTAAQVTTALAPYAPLNAPVFTGDARGVTPAVGDNDTSLATTAFVQSTVAPALNDVGRNLLHNPLFNIAQRGVGPFTANGAYTADRWVQTFNLDTLSTNLFAISDAVRSQIGDEAATNMLSMTVTGNAGAASFSEIMQRIEGVRRLAGKTVTLSFYAVASVGGLKLGVNGYQDFGTGGSPSTAVGVITTGFSVTLTATWQRYSVTFAIPSASGKTLGTAGNDMTVLQMAVSSGATNNATFGNIGVQSGTFQLWGVQLEIGSVATPLEKPDPQQDLARCQRFYQVGNFYYGGYGAAGTGFGGTYTFPVILRATPTITPTFATQTNCGSSAAIGAFGGGFSPYTAITATGGWVLGGYFIASADL